MLIATNIAFITFSTPYCIIYFKLNNEHDVNQSITLLAHVCAYLNNATNFVIYCLFSTKYRQEMREFFYRKKLTRINSKKKKKKYNSIENQNELNGEKFLKPVENVESQHNRQQHELNLSLIHI